VPRDHRYRISALPACFDGLCVLDVETFDGFYAFLAEARGAQRVMAVDNEQYRLWVRARWGVDLAGGEGFRAIHRPLGSTVEYRRLDAFELHRLDEPFNDCFGILHRAESPLGLLRLLHDRLVPGGRVLVETFGSAAPQDGPGDPSVRARRGLHRRRLRARVLQQPRARVPRRVGRYECAEVVDPPVAEGHPRIMATLRAVEAGDGT
jgi:SAM-dependent methyltransferase